MKVQRSIWILLVSGLMLLGREVQAQAPAAQPRSAEPKPSPPGAAQPAPAPAAAGPAVADPGFSGLLDSLWLKVRQTMMSEAEDGGLAKNPRTSAVAGIRGARNQDTILNPIWKGQSRENSLPADLQLFEQAKALYEKKDYPAAVSALLPFAQTYPASSVRPAAQMLLALGYIQSQNPTAARKTLDEFQKDFPDHAFGEQVKQLQAQLAAPPP